nr:DNA helicase [Tanacetum cinerariifolium]GEZ44980.1 DNA helicase [Tanacetum cinerariifolium]
MRRNHANEFANVGSNEFQKQIRNISNHVETLATFDGHDNVLGGYGPGCDVPSAGASLASCYNRTTRIYLDVFRNCSEFCGIKSQGECVRAFRVINRAEDAPLYLDVYQKYSRVSGKVPCVQHDTGVRGSSPFIGGVRDSLDKRKLQPSVSSLCGSSASLPGRSSHANTNAVMITNDSQNSSPVSLRSGNTRENSQLGSTTGVNHNGCSASHRGRNVQVHPRLNSKVVVRSTYRRNDHRVLTSSGIVDTNSVATAGPHIHIMIWETVIVDAVIVGILFDAHNELEQLFRTTRDKCRELEIPEFKIRLYSAEGARGYEVPTTNTLGAMVFENGVSDNADFDVIIQHRDDPPQRVNKFHRSYMSLQFPLLFIYGQTGYHTELTLKSANGVDKGKRVTMLAYYRYRLHLRLHDYLSGLYDAISRGERDGYEVGGRIILPMSFTGVPRYIYAYYLDALAIFQKLGNPQFFITFTCNVSSPEIKRFMSEYSHLIASDRADVMCRVFEQNIQALIAFLKEEHIFGDVTRVEFQKRGLPHRHTLLWVDSTSRIRIAEDVDRFVSAELPDPRTDPEGYNVVSKVMMHGPCGAASFKAPCMKDDKCSKMFSKKFNQKTFFDENGHVHYRRRDTEYCGWSKLIKYLFKYISKGTDRVFARVSRSIGESSTSATPSRQLYKYSSAFGRHASITFRDEDRLEIMIDLPGKKSTTLTEWFAFNEANEVGKHLSYLEFSSEFLWYSNRKSWSPRKNSKSSIGRLAYVHPTSGELFFLGMLLCHQKACKDFWEVQTVNGIFYPTYRAACQALGLLGDDKEWEIAFEEACG